MTTTLEQVIEALRHELQQYGEMLALLETQSHAVAHGESGAVLTSISAVETQSRAMYDARQSRETHQRQLAWAVSQPAGATLQELLPLLPGDYRPLIRALVEEINDLLLEIRQLAEGNERQLRSSLKWMERCLATISAQVELPSSSRSALPLEAGNGHCSPGPISTAVV